jgi:arylsulfatase A-like enzyme
MASWNRRDFVEAAVAGPVTAAIQTGKNISRKPNLLFLWTDEQRPDTMAAYGNRKIQSPSLNRLASQSLVLENPYVSQPVCTPSRSTVMTGLWPHTSGCVANNLPLREDIPCFPQLVEDSSYATGYFGKWHLGDEIFAQHGFQEWRSIEDGYRRYYRAGRDQTQKSSYWAFLKEKGYEPDDPNGDFSRGFAARRPIEHCKPKFLELEACDFLTRHRRDPFILYVNFLEPHMPFFGPLNAEHDPASVDLPPNFNDPLEEDEPLRYRLLVEQYRQRKQDGIDLKDEQGWRRLIANYWGLVTQVDRSVGAILKNLEDLALDDNTVVVYTSDHGDMMGAHRLLAKTVMYEEAVKVPWLMRLPRNSAAGRMVSGRFSQIDMVPTLLDLLGRPVPSHLPGRNLRPVLLGERRQDRDVFIEWNTDRQELPESKNVAEDDTDRRRAANANTRAVITPGGWKLCLSDGDKSQLFNLAEDPGETHNLFYSGRHADVINRLRKRIEDWQAATGDRLRFT